MNIRKKYDYTEQKRKFRQEHRVELAQYDRDRHTRLKREVLTHYGNGKCACVRCGFEDIRALSIDHVNGGGAQHRRELGSKSILVWIRNNNYPDGYQTLCLNCQFIKIVENGERNKGKIPTLTNKSDLQPSLIGLNE